MVGGAEMVEKRNCTHLLIFQNIAFRDGETGEEMRVRLPPVRGEFFGAETFFAVEECYETDSIVAGGRVLGAFACTGEFFHRRGRRSGGRLFAERG